MTTDSLTAREQSSALHPSPEATSHAQIDNLFRLLLECRRQIDEANLLIRRTDRNLETSKTCLKTSEALLARQGHARHLAEPFPAFRSLHLDG